MKPTVDGILWLFPLFVMGLVDLTFVLLDQSSTDGTYLQDPDLGHLGCDVILYSLPNLIPYLPLQNDRLLLALFLVDPTPNDLEVYHPLRFSQGHCDVMSLVQHQIEVTY